jgi:hypothetical protein
VGERDGALVGDHRSLRAEHVGAEGDLEHLAALQGEPLGGLDLGVGLVEERAAHAAIVPGQRPGDPSIA